MTQSTAMFTAEAVRPKSLREVAHSSPVLRQTQAVIGTVILAGVACAVFVDLAFAVVPAIVGVGLLVAGITGICPMALLIARMPWNRSASPGNGGVSCGCS